MPHSERFPLKNEEFLDDKKRKFESKKTLSGEIPKVTKDSPFSDAGGAVARADVG